MSGGMAVGQVVQKVAEEAAEKESVAKVQAPEAQDVARFEEALAGGDPQYVAAQEPPVEVVRPQEPEGPQSLGDSILESMERSHQNHNAQIERINEMVEGGPLDTGDAMRLQVEMMQLKLQEELASKVADGATQTVKTLFDKG